MWKKKTIYKVLNEFLFSACANVILANSQFTRATIAKAFSLINNERVKVLYPGVHLERYDADYDINVEIFICFCFQKCFKNNQK